MKKLVLLLLLTIVISSFVNAKSLDIEFPNGNEFEPGTPITFKVTLYDDSGKVIDGQIQAEIEDAEKKAITEKTVNSREVATVDLGERASSGQGIITATYEDTKSIAFFEVGRKELARFDLDGSTLTVTNIGNTRYSRIITITIGDTIGTKAPDLDLGESTTYRLVAPDGTYNIKVTDGITTLTRGNIRLSGTGQAIGAIDDSASRRSPVTGGISPDGESDVTLLSYIRNNSFVYVFVLVIFGAMVLVAIERRYKKKSRK